MIGNAVIQVILQIFWGKKKIVGYKDENVIKLRKNEMGESDCFYLVRIERRGA